MKKLHIALLSVGATLLVCLCIVLGIFWRGSYCRVTFICEEGCEHTSWQKKGESADLAVVYEDHADKVADKKEPLGIFLDEERLLYYFEETLDENSKTYYLGRWNKVGPMQSQAFRFTTPHGAIMIYMGADDFPTGSSMMDERKVLYEELTERFYRAYEALGGSREDSLYFTYRIPDTLLWYCYTEHLSEENSASLNKIFFVYSMLFYYQTVGGHKPTYYYPVEDVLVTTEPSDTIGREINLNP